MARIEKSIEVQVPLQTAYNQWTQFEEFPRFMEGIQEVHQVDDARLTWVASVGGERKEWYARITQQVPDQVIAWESEGGVPNAGIVTFHRLGADKTEVNVQMDYEPEDFKEAVGDKLGFVSRRVEGDLKRFKEFIEERGSETGAWRGEVSGGEPSGEEKQPPGGGYSPTEARTGPAEAREMRERAGTGPETSNTTGPDTRQFPDRPGSRYGPGGTNYGGPAESGRHGEERGTPGGRA